MRVLRTEGSEQKDWIPSLCTHRGQPYAILSHRWFEEVNHEILFADIEEVDQTVIGPPEDQHVNVVKNAQYVGGTAKTKPGFKKIQGAARQALKDGYDYIWIDTCCIDKSSSAELAEAINSMFKWYKASSVCYAYLMDVSDATDTSQTSSFATSQWWKRGWTLQELLAPSEVTFFTSDWKVIGNRSVLSAMIVSITGISMEIFEEQRDIDTFSIAQRMSWASGRTTTRPEDMAYCLMGLFDVNMPVLYGEGEKAFIRLQQEIIKESEDESIFAWRDESTMSESYSGMLATRPAAFAGSQNVEALYGIDQREPYNMTNKGLLITLPIRRITCSPSNEDNIFIAMLECATAAINGNQIGIFLRKISSKGKQFARVRSLHWIEEAPPVNGELTTIYVKQSWNGFLGWLGIFQMTMDADATRPPSCASQDDQNRHEINISQLANLDI